MVWYVVIDGKAKTIPEEVLIYKIENKEITPETLVVNEQIKNWVKISDTYLWKIYAADTAHKDFGTQRTEKNSYQQKNYVESTNYDNDVPQEQFLGLAIAGFIFSIMGFFILPIVFSVLGLIFGIIAAYSSPSEYKNRARGWGIAALISGAIGVVIMIFNMLWLGGYL